MHVSKHNYYAPKKLKKSVYTKIRGGKLLSQRPIKGYLAPCVQTLFVIKMISDMDCLFFFVFSESIVTVASPETALIIRTIEALTARNLADSHFP